MPRDLPDDGSITAVLSDTQLPSPAPASRHASFPFWIGELNSAQVLQDIRMTELFSLQLASCRHGAFHVRPKADDNLRHWRRV